MTTMLLLFGGLLVVNVAGTAFAVWLFGRRVATNEPGLAILLSGLVVPVSLLLLSLAWFIFFSPEGPPPNDAGAMALVGGVYLVVLAVPFSIGSAAFMLRRFR